MNVVKNYSLVLCVTYFQQYAKQVLSSYLHLLVNTRSELALANIINVPDRGIDHKAFTELKKIAQQKKMPLYQVNKSFLSH